MLETQELTILGTGPAGLTAAIYAARAGLNPLCIEGEQPGGQLMLTSDVENYPGFPKAIEGPALMEAFREQAQFFGAKLEQGLVTAVDLTRSPFTITLDSRTFKTKALIIATGAQAKWLNLDSEKKFLGKGVSACATCDGFFFKNQDVLVVGGGDTALEEALFLTRFATSVTVVHRRNTLKASKVMQDKAFKHPKIQFLWEYAVESIEGSTAVEEVLLKHLPTGAIEKKKVQGVFVAIGHEPNTKLFKPWLAHDALGYLIPSPLGSSKTSIEGVFVAGDVADSRYRQAITAAGMGCMAAIDAERYLDAL